MRSVIWAFLVLALGVVSFAHGDDRSAGPAVAAAKARQEFVKTLYVQFRRTEVIPPGGVSKQSAFARPNVLVPESETTVESTNSLVIDGDKVRYEDNHSYWAMPEGKLRKDSSSINLFNGSMAKKFFPNGVGGGGQAHGYIERDPRQEQILAYELAPLMVTFRGLSPGFVSCPITDLKPSGISIPIDGAQCQEHVVNISSDLTNSFWTDPGRGYVIRRIRLQGSVGQLIEQTDITFRPHDAWGWVPDSWVRTRYAKGGALLTTTKVTVLEMQINAPQPAEQFDIEFPTGSIVTDQRNWKTYRVQPDGSMREYDRTTRKELSGSVSQPGVSWYRRNKWLLVGLGVVTILLVVGYMTKKRRASTA